MALFWFWFMVIHWVTASFSSLKSQSKVHQELLAPKAPEAPPEKMAEMEEM